MSRRSQTPIEDRPQNGHPTLSPDRNAAVENTSRDRQDSPTTNPAGNPGTEAEPSESTEPAQEKRKFSPFSKLPKRRRRLVLAGLGLGAVVAGLGGLRWWQYTSAHQSTDDAYVASNVHPVSSRVNGTVAQVLVNDNQQVQAGQVLVKLDPRDYQNQVQQAQAALAAAKQQAETARTQIAFAAQNAQGTTTQAQGDISNAEAAIANAQAQVNEAQAGVPAAQAQVAQANANLQKAQADFTRFSTLYQQGAVSREQLDTARNAYQVAQAQQNAAQQQVNQAQAKLAQAQQQVAKAQAQLTTSQGGLQQAQATGVQTQVNRNKYQEALAAVTQAQAKLKDAQLQLSYTVISAPTAGVVGNKHAEVGQRVQPGTPLMAIVDNQNWVVANFKETQLGKMHPGQPVEIKLDAFPNHPFAGHVDSFSPASGAQFALLPPDNATGNFTKVVQRIPVKVVFEPQSIQGYESRITPGMSADVSVDVK